MTQNDTKNSLKDFPVVSGIPRTEAERLMAENKNLIYSVMQRRFPSLMTSENKEEAVAVGLLWLWKAALCYDPAKGRFSTLACRYIWGGLMRHLQERKRAGRLPTVSLDAPLGENADGDLYDILGVEDIAAPLCPSSNPGAALLTSAGLDGLLEGVPDGAKEVLRLLCEEELSLTDAADRLGVSKQRIAQLREVGIEAVVTRHSAGALTEYRSLQECRARRGRSFRAKCQNWSKQMDKRASAASRTGVWP